MSQSQNPAETSTDHEQPTPTAHKSGMTRRDLLRRSAVGGATLAGVSAGAIRLDHGPVQESQAIAPVVAAGAVGGSMATGWALRELEIVGSDDPPSGLTGDALRNEFFNIARSRASTNASSILDNENIIEGIDHAAHADGKIAAIDVLNEQQSQDDVEDAAHDAVDSYETTVRKNLYNTWNEAVEEFYSYVNTAEDHSDLSRTSLITVSTSDTSTNNQTYDGIDSLNEMGTHTTELPNGEEFELNTVSITLEAETGSTGTDEWSPVDRSRDTSQYYVRLSTQEIRASNPGDGDDLRYLNRPDWSGVNNEIKDLFDDVRSGLSVWVDGVYNEVQSGELDTTELLTPREQAELTSDDEDFPQAVADLQALNVAIDYEREAEIYMPEISATIYGQLGYGGDGTLETGEINPDDKDSSIYLTYDVSQGQGTWDAYEDGIDGGELTFTSEPFEETLFVVDTVAGETVELTDDDFDETDDGDEWTVDLSDDLDDAITQVDQVGFYAQTTETQYETIRLTERFEIIRYTDSDGNEYEETSFERSEPQTDDNYITEEEWQEQQERHEELIQQYEDAQGSGISIPGVEDVLSGEANGLIGIAVVGFVLVSAILSALNPLS